MSSFKVITGDKVGTFATKYNSLVDTVIESVETVNDVDSATITYHLNGGGTFNSRINIGGVITGNTYDSLLDLTYNNGLVAGKVYELDFNTIDCISYTDTIYTGATETLYLTASSTNSFYAEVISKQYPQDIIYYDFTNHYAGTDISTTHYLRPGYIYYRKDTIRNIEVEGYDFREHILLRYNANSTGYTQWSSSSTYIKGNYVWYSDVLYYCFIPITSPTLTTPYVDSLSWKPIANKDQIFVSKTGSTNFGAWSIYPNINTAITGYTFSTDYYTNNGSANINNVKINSSNNYIGTSIGTYVSTNYQHKPNVVFWCSGLVNNIIIDGNTTDLTFISGYVSDITFCNCNNIVDTSYNYYDNDFSNVSSIISFGFINNNNIKNSYNISFSNNSNNDIMFSSYLFIVGSTTNTINESYILYLYYVSTTELNYCNTIQYPSGGSGNALLYSVNIYQSSSNYNILNFCSNFKLEGSYNVFNTCVNFGTVSGSFKSNYSVYETNCNNFNTTGTHGFENCKFGPSCGDISIDNANVSVTYSEFANNTTYVTFSTDSVSFVNFTKIKTSQPYNGSVTDTGGSGTLIIKLTSINNRHFVGLDGGSKLVDIKFSGLTPTYTNIESYQ